MDVLVGVDSGCGSSHVTSRCGRHGWVVDVVVPVDSRCGS